MPTKRISGRDSAWWLAGASAQGGPYYPWIKQRTHGSRLSIQSNEQLRVEQGQGVSLPDGSLVASNSSSGNPMNAQNGVSLPAHDSTASCRIDSSVS